MSPNDVELSQLSARVAALERDVRLLTEQLNPHHRTGSSFMSYPDVTQLKREGKIIEAIKLYREKTNTGLAEAKEFVDNLQI